MNKSRIGGAAGIVKFHSAKSLFELSFINFALRAAAAVIVCDEVMIEAKLHGNSILRDAWPLWVFIKFDIILRKYGRG